MIEVIGKLSQEDLNRLRATRCKRIAVENNPRAYSARETEQIYIDDARLIGEFCERYSIDGTRPFVVSQYSGDLYYDE